MSLVREFLTPSAALCSHPVGHGLVFFLAFGLGGLHLLRQVLEVLRQDLVLGVQAGQAFFGVLARLWEERVERVG